MTWEEFRCESKVLAYSDDSETKVFCALELWNVDYALFFGNRIPLSLAVLPERTVRPEKYKYIQHAEINAITWVAAQPLLSTLGAIMWLNWFPCNTCALAIINAGITMLHVDKEKYESRVNDPKYDFLVAKDNLEEAGVEIVWH